MRLVIFSIALALASGCGPKEPQNVPPVKTPNISQQQTQQRAQSNISVSVSPREDGYWQVDYVFSDKQSAVIMTYSENDYRSKTWESLDANTHFERIEGFDTFLFDTPSVKASFKFKPHTENIRRAYTPFIPFSDGGLAVHTGQFEVLSVKNRAAVEILQGDIQKWKGDQFLHTVRVLSKQTMIVDGNIVRGEAVDDGTRGSAGRYIYVGKAKITQGQDFSGVIDPGLPAWLVSRFDKDLTKIFEGYRALWGEGLPVKSTILFSFRGYDHEGFSMGGGALSSMLALETSGQSLRKADNKKLQRFHWFFAHEIAHLFQTRHGVHLDILDNAWINEGAANTMANDVLHAQGLAGEAYFNKEYAQEYTECTAYLKTGKMTEAASKGHYNVPYSCGDIIGQITDGSLPGHTIFEFWNEMLEGVKEDGEYTAADYFRTMEKLGAPDHIVAGLRKLTSEKVDDPAVLLSSLMKDTGLAPKFDKAGNLISLKLP